MGCVKRRTTTRTRTLACPCGEKETSGFVETSRSPLPGVAMRERDELVTWRSGGWMEKDRRQRRVNGVAVDGGRETRCAVVGGRERNKQLC